MTTIDSHQHVSAQPQPDLCPYCGEASETLRPGEAAVGGVAGTPRCRACLAFLDPLSKQVTQGHMGPWYIRDVTRPFYPGIAWEVMVVLIARGEVTAETVLRGPGSGQFWARASRIQGVANLLGTCHACGAEASRSDTNCHACGVSFLIGHDRDRLGLPGCRPSQRISAFASDEELRSGAPAPRAPAPSAAGLAPLPPRPASEGGLTALEITLGHEVATEKRRSLFLLMIVAALLVAIMVLAAWALLLRRG
ncbi:MAG: hypothetical protein SGJ11_12555 [Phycisphaerae bacterium]|nr:hypothetical protein [Phycisphaerae bacterium]